MTTRFAEALTGLTNGELEHLVLALETKPRRGRPWSRALRDRLVMTCIALRTNLTMREIAAIFSVSKSTVHRVLTTLTPRIARLHDREIDRRYTWIVDGTLIPTRDHAAAAKSKNYRWSCNVQIIARRIDLRIVAVDGGGPGNRNDPIHYRRSFVERLCQLHGRVLADGGYRGVPELVTPVFRRNRIVRNAAWRRHRHRRARVEHAISRLKNWRILRDHRRRGCHLLDTVRAIAFLHNLQLKMRDSP